MPVARPPLLIICYTFPPAPGIGGRRWAKFAKVFARRGHPVHVICAAPPSGAKPSPWTTDARTPGITTHYLPARYPMVLHRWPLTRFTDKVRYHMWVRLLPFLVKGNPLDATAFWHDQLINKASDLIRTHGIRHLIATGAPFRLLYHGTELKARHPGLHLLSDLRDPWTWWDNYGHGSLSPRRFAEEQAFEARVMRESDVITSPSAAVIEHIRTHYPEQAEKCLRIPHSIDPDDVGELPSAPADDHFRLIYAGTLYGASEANTYFGELIKAFQGLEAQAPEQAARTTMTFLITANDAGPFKAMVREAGLDDRILFEAPVPPSQVFGRLAAANAALVFIPSKNKDLLGTKFTELFHVGRPVIHVGAYGDVGGTIERHRLGVSLRVEELATELPRIVLGERRLPTEPLYDKRAYELGPVAERLSTRLGL